MSLAWLAALPALAAGAEPLAIVVSSRWQGADAIELRDLREVYLGRRTRLFGASVRRIDLAPGSAARAGFSRSVLGRSEQDLERYWIEQALSGGALPPREVATPPDAVAAAEARVGTIAYLPASSLARLDADGVRILPILVDGVATRPGAPGYPARTLD
ncbi:MAG: hypothetical protein ACQGVC_21990 [Myxococcota bacterium]